MGKLRSRIALFAMAAAMILESGYAVGDGVAYAGNGSVALIAANTGRLTNLPDGVERQRGSSRPKAQVWK